MNISDLSTRLGISVQDDLLFETAFTHKSYANERTGREHNERLEFLGDAVLELATTKFLYAKFPQEPEGKLTKLRSALVSGVSLSEVASCLEFGDFLRLSRGEEASGGRTKNPLLADTFEAVVGAIYLDQDFDAAENFLKKQLFPRLPEVLEKELHIDAKSALQELVQEREDITPHYEVLSEAGPDHAKEFLSGVFVGEKKIGEGKGSSKQKAEVDAATNALEEWKKGQ